MATDLARITGSVPYVTVSNPLASPVEYVTEFAPLGTVTGDVVLNLSDGAYYEALSGGSGTAAVWKRGDNQARLVVAAEPPTGIDGKSPYTAITDLVPTLTVSNHVITNVAYADNRSNPAKGYDYVAFANTLYDAVFTDITAASLTAVTGGTEYENFLANIALWKGALADPVKRVAIEKWAIDGGLLDLVLAASDPFDDGDQFTDNVALEEGGIAFSSPLGVAANTASGRSPQRGPFDYVVTPGSTAFATTKAPEIDTIADLQASAYLPGRLATIVVGGDRDGMEATPGEVANGAITKTTVPVYSKAAWASDQSVNIGDIEAAWDGSGWVLRDLTATAPVTALAASGQTNTAITLTWTNPVDADLATIIVRRATGATAPATATAGTGVTVVGKPETVTDSGLTINTQYSYSVFARDTANT
jgi:hypothetical protein